MAHGQHVPFGGVRNFARTCVGTHQAERAGLFALLPQGFPKLRNLRLDAGGAKSPTGRPMIFSRGSPKSLPTPTLASLELPSSSATRMGAEG